MGTCGRNNVAAKAGKEGHAEGKNCEGGRLGGGNRGQGRRHIGSIGVGEAKVVEDGGEVGDGPLVEAVAL
jgi:hypothetical protein